MSVVQILITEDEVEQCKEGEALVVHNGGEKYGQGQLPGSNRSPDIVGFPTDHTQLQRWDPP